MADRTSLSRATESSDAPTPGYLYIDIARGAASSPVACRETAQYLVRRLQNKQNHNIKFKCLKVIQKTAESPLTRGQFKRDICQDPSSIAAIKDALQFRGPPDPARGDSIYEKVRNAAKECLDAVYADGSVGGGGGMESGMVSGSSMNAGLAGGIGSSYGNSVGGGNGGFGAPSAGVSGGMGGGMGSMGGRKMEGIGNPMFKDPRLEESSKKNIGRMTIGEVATAVGSTVAGMIKDPLARNVSSPHSMPSVTVNHSNRIGNLPGYGGSSGGGGGYGGSSGGYGNNTGGGYGGGGGGYNSQPPGARELAQQTGGAWTMATNRGPNAIGGNVHGGTAAHAPSGVGGSWASAPSNNVSVAAQSRAAAHSNSHVSSAIPIAGNSAYQSTGTAASDGTYERNLISELCPPGGMRPEPPEDKLLKFTQSVPSLNSDLVCPALLDALEDGQPWIIKAKTLCVIEKTIHAANETMGESNAYSDFFHMCAGEIEPLTTHSRPAVRDPAKRVMKALGLAVATTKPTSKAEPTANPPAAAPPAPPPPAPVNLLDFGEEDEFGSTPAPATVPDSAPPPPPSEPPAPPVSKTSEENSLFGGLQVNDSSATTTEPSSTPSTAQSAFGFISASTTSAEPPAPPDPPQPPPTKPEDELLSLASPSTVTTMNPPPTNQPPVFDPLLSLGPDTTTTLNPMQPMMNPSMQMPMQMPVPLPSSPSAKNKKISNSQIEVMSYQQNMLMMQQRMQQMQLAMAMQQQQNSQTGVKSQSSSTGQSSSNVMQAHNSFIPDMNMMQPIGGSSNSKMGQFSILENAKKEEQQKSFDFIKDAMKGAK